MSTPRTEKIIQTEEIMLRRWNLLAALVVALGTALVGCDDDGGGGGGGGGDTGDTGGETGIDTGIDTVEEQGDTSTCGTATECVGNGDCLTTEFCNAGCCEDRVVTEQCTSHNEPCEGDDWTTDDFACADLGSGETLCHARCDSSTTVSTQDDACPAGAFCLELAEPDPALAPLDGVCETGTCNDACFDAADCAGETPFSCADGEGTCFAYNNGASFCFEAGEVDEGGECGATDELADTCAAGLLCFNGTCVVPCTDDAQCTGDGETCVEAFTRTGDNEPGACAVECEPFSSSETNTCPDGFRCDPNIVGFGAVPSWSCLEVDDAITVVGFGDECDVNMEDNQCGEGLVCSSNFDGDLTGVCTQLCDSTREAEGDFVDCPSVPGAELFIDDTAFVAFPAQFEDGVNALGPEDIAAVDGQTVQIINEDDDILAEIDGATFAEGEQGTAVAHLDADGNLAVSYFVDWTVETDGLDADMAGLRLYNVSDVDVDAYTAGEDFLGETDLLPGETTGNLVSVASPDGAHGVEVQGTFGEDPDAVELRYFVEVEGGAGDESVEVIVMGSGDPEAAEGTPPFTFVAIPHEIPASTDPWDPDTEALIRIINASVSLQTMQVRATEVGTFADLAYGEATDWVIVASADADTDFIAAYREDAEADDVEVLLSDTGPGEVRQVVIYDDGDTVESLILEGTELIAEGDVWVRVTNVSDALLTSLRDETPIGSAASGATLPADDGAESVAADATGVLRDADAAADEFPLAEGPVAVPAGEILSLVVVNLADGSASGSGLDDDFVAPDDLDDLATAGDTRLRFIHAADGIAALRPVLGGDSPICVPSGADGIGVCREECNPYPITDPVTPYVDEDGNPTDRWVDNGCSHEDNVVFSCLPFVTNGDELTTIIDEPGHPDLAGYCVPRETEVGCDARCALMEPGADQDACEAACPDVLTASFGDDCATAGDAVCTPDAWCVEEECTKLCLPFQANGPADCDDEEVCVLYSLQSFGLCLTPQLDEIEGDACTVAQRGQVCSGGNDVLCIQDSDTTAACYRFCKVPLNDSETGANPGCPAVEGSDAVRTCLDIDGPGGVFSDDYPWLSLCVDVAE
jgi:hypothetical protein